MYIIWNEVIQYLAATLVGNIFKLNLFALLWSWPKPTIKIFIII